MHNCGDVTLLFERGDVGQVLRSPCRPFVLEKCGASDERNSVPPERALVTAGPNLMPSHAIDGAHDVQLDRRNAHLYYFVAGNNVFRRDAGGWEAELSDRGKQAFTVIERGMHQQVEVTGEPRRAVERERVGADDDKLNAFGDQ